MLQTQVIVSKVNFAECGTFVKLLEIVGKKKKSGFMNVSLLDLLVPPQHIMSQQAHLTLCSENTFKKAVCRTLEGDHIYPSVFPSRVFPEFLLLQSINLNKQIV